MDKNCDSPLMTLPYTIKLAHNGFLKTQSAEESFKSLSFSCGGRIFYTSTAHQHQQNNASTIIRIETEYMYRNGSN